MWRGQWVRREHIMRTVQPNMVGSMALKRGIVLGPNVSVNVAENRISTGEGGSSSSLLRHSLLYFDKIEWPTNNLIQIGDPEIDQLISLGVAQSTKARLDLNGNWAELYVRAQFQTYQALASDKDYVWTIGQQANILNGPQELLEDTQAFEIELNGLLPTPPSDIALDELLEFKAKRYDEYADLRIKIDEIADAVNASGNFPRAKDAAVHRLTQAIEAVQKVSAETWVNRVSSSMKYSFNLKNAMVEYLKGAGFASTFAAAFHMPALAIVAGAANAARSVVSVDLKTLVKPKGLPDALTPYAYLLEVEREFPGTLKKK